MEMVKLGCIMLIDSLETDPGFARFVAFMRDDTPVSSWSQYCHFKITKGNKSIVARGRDIYLYETNNLPNFHYKEIIIL